MNFQNRLLEFCSSNCILVVIYGQRISGPIFLMEMIQLCTFTLENLKGFFGSSLLLFLKLNLNLYNSLSYYLRGFFGCRSRKKYSSLLKFLEQNDLALKSLMGRVELLVFPSSLLHKNSQSELASLIFLSCFSNFANKQDLGFLALSL